MIALLVLAAAAFVLFRLLGGAPRLRVRRNQPAEQTSAKVQELSDYANRQVALKKYASAEKVYLQILKMDHRHVPTYTNLAGMYAAQKNYADAIECFQVATQLSPSGETFYNLGLAYYDNENYMKAVAAFEKGIMFEPSTQHYVGLAKAFNRMHDGERVIRTLEQAVEFEATPRLLWLLHDAYIAASRDQDAQPLLSRLHALDPKDKRLHALRQAAKKGASARSRTLERRI